MTWKEKALAALELSIEHWERLVSGNRNHHERPLGHQCACCDTFSMPACDGCPIRLRTGVIQCAATPFEDASNIWDELCEGLGRDEIDDALDDPEFKAAAQSEVDYLRETLRMVEAGEVAP